MNLARQIQFYLAAFLTFSSLILYAFQGVIELLAPTDPNSVGVRISCVKAIFEECYGFEHFLTSTTMPFNLRTVIVI